MPNPNTPDGNYPPTPATTDPTVVARASDPEVITAQKAVTAAQSIVDQSLQEYQQAAADFDKIMAQPSAAYDTGGGVKAAGQRVADAQKALSEARTKLSDAWTSTANAATNAAARAARANDTQLNDYYEQNANKAVADGALAKAQADAVNAKTPSDIDQANAAVAEASARAQSLGILTPAQAAQANAAANESTARASSINALIPSQVAATNAQAAASNAQASASSATAANTAAQTDQLVPAQAKQALAAAGFDDAQAAAVIGKTPAEIDQLVAQGQLSQAQADLVKAQIPNAQAQTGLTQATTGKTVADTQQLKLGGLYGIQDRINAMRDAIAQGRVTPDEANNQLQQYIDSQVQTAISGASQFDRSKAALDAETQRRQQDSSLAGTDASAFGSGFSSSLSTFGKLNDTTPVGSDSAGLGFLASLQKLRDGLGSFQPSTPVDSPLLQSLRPNAPAAAPATAPAPAPAAAASAPAVDSSGGGHQITINIGGTGGAPAVASAPAPATPAPFAQSGIPEGSNRQTMPAFLDSQRAATPTDVAALWAGDPHFDPNQASTANAAGQE